MEKAHQTALETKHEGIEALIDAEHRRPAPDDLKLTELKKQKLRLKEVLTNE